MSGTFKINNVFMVKNRKPSCYRKIPGRLKSYQRFYAGKSLFTNTLNFEELVN
jgi:hypothetical protein